MGLNLIASIKTLYGNVTNNRRINFNYPPLTLKNYVWRITISRSLKIRLPKYPPKQRYRRILVICSYRPDRTNLVEKLIISIKEAMWTKIDLVLNNYGNSPPSAVESPFVKYELQKAKFQIVPEIIKNEFKPYHNYVMTIDDDVLLPEEFFDKYFKVVDWLGLKLSQPALAKNSFHSHLCTLQIDGAIAHLTPFIEIGPVTCFSKEMVEILPFEECPPMGWGVDFMWSHICMERRWPMGVIDCTPIQHALRSIGNAYNRKKEMALMEKYLSKKHRVPFIVTEIIGQIIRQEELPYFI